jgi:putative endonuclease
MYILECADQSFYVGSTWDLERRLAQHNSDDEGAAYTRRRRPVRLVYFEHSESIADAYTREKQVQGWGRAKRIALIEGRHDELPRLTGAKPE